MGGGRVKGGGIEWNVGVLAGGGGWWWGLEKNNHRKRGNTVDSSFLEEQLPPGDWNLGREQQLKQAVSRKERKEGGKVSEVAVDVQSCPIIIARTGPDFTPPSSPTTDGNKPPCYSRPITGGKRFRSACK